MRYIKTAVLSVAVLGLLLVPVAAADCEKHAEAKAASESGGCCSKKAHKEEAELKDCCKEAGGRDKCEKCAEAEAAHAKSGCSKATATEHHSAEAVMLASNAQNGCSKSAAKLVAMAKESGCPKSHALAAKAEKGDEKARAELIAMYAGDHSEE